MIFSKLEGRLRLIGLSLVLIYGVETHSLSAVSLPRWILTKAYKRSSALKVNMALEISCSSNNMMKGGET